MNWNRPAVKKLVKEVKNFFLEKSYIFVLQYTNIGKIKIFSVIHDKFAMLTRRCSEWGTRNRHQNIFRQVLTVRKR